MTMALLYADDVDTSSSCNFDLHAEPMPPWVPEPGICPSEPVYRRKPCRGEPGHKPPHWDGYGTSWWPVSCVDCGGNHEGMVDVVEYKPHRYRCVSAIGCRRRQRRARHAV